MDQWLKQMGKLQGKNNSNARTKAPQSETKTMGLNSHMATKEGFHKACSK
jgi:hypothetical protein